VSNAAAMWGLAENQALPVQHRLECALQALKHFGGAVEKLEEWCVQQDALSKGESMTTAAIRKMLEETE
jgi:hypothetical protein